MKKRIRALTAFLIIIAMLLETLTLSYASAVENKSNKNEDNGPTKKLLVKYKDNAKKTLKNRLKADTKKQRKFKNVFGEKIELMSIDSEDEASFRKDSEVELVEEDGIVQTSDDKITWNVNYINAQLSHDKGYNGKSIKVAIFDTGIDTNSADLNVVGGISFVDGVTSYSDDNGHGTAMAGVLATTRNNSGLIGVAPEIELYSVKVLDQNGTGSYSDIIEGIQWAIDNDIDVISMSFGGVQYSKILEDVINEAYSRNILIIAASGNNSSNSINYPANYHQVICVGAIDNNGNVASFSNYGSEMDIVAPGVNVETIGINNTSLNVSGTSPAVPHVVGVAAQILSANNNLSLDEVKAILYKSAVPVYGMIKEKYGWGIVSSYNSIENINAGLELDDTPSQVEFVGHDAGTEGSVNLSFIIYGNQTIFIGQSATVRAGFYSPHASLTITVENSSGSVIYSETRSPIGGNGAYVTFTAPSYLFGSSGTYYIRYHCADNLNSSYDDVFTINVIPAAAGTPRSVSFSESTSQSQSQTISIPNLNSITGITVDNGSVNYSISGSNVTINVSGGSATRTSSQVINEYRESTINSFSDSIPYNNGNCNGTLDKSGSSYVSGQSPPDTKTITNYSFNTGTTYPSSSYSYSSNGYTGTLSRSSVSDNGRYEDRGSYQQQSQYFTDSHTNVCTTVYKRPTKTASWSLYSDTQSSPAPSSKSVNSNGYVGSIPRTTTTQNYRNESFSSDGLTWTITASYTANYGGTLYKTVWVPNNVWISNYTGYYSGTATKPGSTLYRQNYSGTIYGFSPYYYAYNVVLYYTAVIPPDDFGNDSNTATTITLGSNKNGTIDYAGDNDWFKFVPSISGSYNFYTTGSTDTYGHLYNSGVTQINADNDLGEGSNFLMTQNLTAGQTYYIKVRHASGSGTGNYTLIVTNEIASPTNVSISSQTTTSANITWNASLNATGYKVLRNGIEIATTTNISYSDNNLASLTPGDYTYTIQAYNASKTSLPSSPVSITVPPTTTQFAWPVPSSSQISLFFGDVDAESDMSHTGIDIQSTPGADIHSAVNGVVVYCGEQNGYGKVVYINTIYNGRFVQTRYAHLQAYNVSFGSIVNADDVIGTMGSTGTTAGTSSELAVLHFQVLQSQNECYPQTDGLNSIDPLEFVCPIGYFDDRYLFDPVAVGQTPGDNLTINEASSSTLFDGDVISSETSQEVADKIAYIKNQDLPDGCKYLSKLYDTYSKVKLRGQSASRSYNPTTGIATFTLNGRTFQFGTSLHNVLIIHGRMVVIEDNFISLFGLQTTGFIKLEDFLNLNDYSMVKYTSPDEYVTKNGFLYRVNFPKTTVFKRIGVDWYVSSTGGISFTNMGSIIYYNDAYDHQYIYIDNAYWTEMGEHDPIDLGDGHTVANCTILIRCDASMNEDFFIEIRVKKHYFSNINLAVYESANGGFHVNPLSAYVGKRMTFTEYREDTVRYTIDDMQSLNYQHRIDKWYDIGKLTFNVASDFVTIITLGTSAAASATIKGIAIAVVKEIVPTTVNEGVKFAITQGGEVLGDYWIHNSYPQDDIFETVTGILPFVGTYYALVDTGSSEPLKGFFKPLQ